MGTLYKQVKDLEHKAKLVLKVGIQAFNQLKMIGCLIIQLFNQLKT